MFLVGHAGGSAGRAAAVLLEPEGVFGYPPARRGARKSTAGAPGDSAASAGVVSLQDVRGIDKGQNGRGWNEDGTSYTIDTAATQGVLAFDYKQSGGDATREVSPPLRATPHATSWANGGGHVGVVHAEAFKASHYTRGKDGAPSTVTPPISADADYGDQDTPTRWVVRRLTPRECERLQGFPDDVTLIPWRGALATDANRYRVLGNSMAVDVIRWIGARIAMVDAIE